MHLKPYFQPPNTQLSNPVPYNTHITAGLSYHLAEFFTIHKISNISKYFYPLYCRWLILPIQNDAKELKMTETLAHGYSSESTVISRV